MPDSNQYIILLGICILYIVVFYFAKRSRSTESTIKDFIMEWFLLIALMPTLFKTDTQHFLFSVPLLLILCCYFFTHRNIIALVLFILFVILYDGNSYDIFGRELSNRIYNMGVLGISNILIASLTLIIYFRDVRNGQKEAEV